MALGKFTGTDVALDIATKFRYKGPLAKIFAENDGPLVDKWHHYIPLYDRYLGHRRNTAFKFLEIGVSKGGSLAMWRKFFGPKVQIFGIDIDPTCARFDGRDGQVRIGSQDDPAFLAQVVSEMGGVDVVLDDGSHVMEHIRASLKVLFPLLNDRGTYIIEDLHTAYWRKNYGGGMRHNRNFFGDLLPMIHDMHHWYHPSEPFGDGFGRQMAGIHIHDSMVVLEKDVQHAPVRSIIGKETAG